MVVLSLAVTDPAEAAQADISHILSSRLAVGTDEARVQQFDLEWRPEVRWRFDGGGRLTGMGRARYQPSDGMRTGDLGRGTYSRPSRPTRLGDRLELELRELYYERPVGGWYVSVGKQQVVWGKADGLKVLDVVDPQSFREFILEDFEQSRIPLWTLDAERPLDGWLGDGWTLQLLWIPDRTYDALPAPGATYAFRSPRLVPRAPPGVRVRLNDARRPGPTLAASDAGLRLSRYAGGWDLSFNYLYQYHNQPVLRQRFSASPVPTVEIRPVYRRTHLIGATFSHASGDWVTRGEIGYFTERLFLTDAPGDGDGVAASGELDYVLGLDWSGATDTFISGQLFQSRLSRHRSGITRPRLDTNLTLLVRRNFRNETMTAEVLWIVNTNEGDGLVRPRLAYDLEDNLEVWLGADVFYGDTEGLFGQFRDNDRIMLGMKLGL